MRAHKLQVQIPADHRLSLELPESFPAGPAEVIILTQAQDRPRIYRAGGSLSAKRPGDPGDPVAEALKEIRTENTVKIDQLSGELERLRS